MDLNFYEGVIQVPTFALPYSKAVGKSLRQHVSALSANMFALSVFDISAFHYFFPAQIAFCSISLLCTLY